MSDLVPYDPREDSTFDEQIADALEKALEIQGTVLNDLETAINCILQMERAMGMCGVPNPNQVSSDYLKKKYKMYREQAAERHAEYTKLLEENKDRNTLHPIEVVEPKKELVQSTDEIVDGEVVE